jgi:hypothetical protein
MKMSRSTPTCLRTRSLSAQVRGAECGIRSRIAAQFEVEPRVLAVPIERRLAEGQPDTCSRRIEAVSDIIR